MIQIDYFYTLLSPFTYLAGDGLERISERRGASVRYRPADISAVFGQTGGLPVPKRHPARQAYRLQELERLSAMSGLPLNVQPAHWPTDATRALLAVIAVDMNGGDAATLSRAFMRACWAEQRDIGDAATVLAILAENDCPAEAADMSAEARTRYDQNTEAAIEAGVFGAPFYIVNGQKFWGQDRLPHLDWYLEQQGG